jgi:hypothetical protein
MLWNPWVPFDWCRDWRLWQRVRTEVLCSERLSLAHSSTLIVIFCSSLCFVLTVVFLSSMRGLHEWMRLLLACKPLLAKFYEPGASALDSERVGVFLGQLAILARFGVVLNLEYEGLSLKRT